MTMNIAVLIVLSASATSAFVQVGPAPTRSLPALHATEAFQRSLLATRLGTNSNKNGGAAGGAAPSSLVAIDANEKFQRSLLEAKLSYDAIDAALAVDVAETAAPVVEEQAAAAAIPNESDASEKFQRSLLEAKLAYDARAAALAVDVAETAAPLAEEEEEEEDEVEAVAVAEPEPIAAVAAPEPEPEPVVAPTPEPETPKPVTPEPVRAKRVVKLTEFTVPREFAIVPINEASVQFTAGTLGAVAGLALGGPIFAAIGASAFNYLSRKDDDRRGGATSAKKVVDTASQTVLLAYNFLAQFEKDNKVVDSVLGLFEKVVDKAKESESPAGDALVTLESTLGGIANKVEELNDDFDLVGGAGTVLGSVGDLVEIGFDKVADVNDEYKLTDRAGGLVKGVVGKVPEK